MSETDITQKRLDEGKKKMVLNICIYPTSINPPCVSEEDGIKPETESFSDIINLTPQRPYSQVWYDGYWLGLSC